MGNTERRLGRGLGSLLGGSLGGVDPAEGAEKRRVEELHAPEESPGPEAIQANAESPIGPDQAIDETPAIDARAATTDSPVGGVSRSGSPLRQFDLHPAASPAPDRKPASTRDPADEAGVRSANDAVRSRSSRGGEDGPLVREEPFGTIPVARIRPNPFQPRKQFDAEGLEELRASIQSHGLLQPVVVRRAHDGFELIAGERRWRASRMAGLDAIRAVIRDRVSDREMLELALVENVQRRALNPIEKANGYSAMMQELSLTQEQVADKVGLKRSSVANHLRLLTLPLPAQEAVSLGRLSMGHARALVGIPNEDLIAQLVERIQREDLSVRQVEGLVRDMAANLGTGGMPQQPGATESQLSSETPPQLPWIAEVEGRLRSALGTKVQVRNGKDYRGQILIDYYSRKDLDRLIALLAQEESL